MYKVAGAGGVKRNGMGKFNVNNYINIPNVMK